jgi:hypothetical protein
MATPRSVATKMVRRRSLLCLPPVLAVAAAVATTAPASAGVGPERASTAVGVLECAADLVGR